MAAKCCMQVALAGTSFSLLQRIGAIVVCVCIISKQVLISSHVVKLFIENLNSKYLNESIFAAKWSQTVCSRNWCICGQHKTSYIEIFFCFTYMVLHYSQSNENPPFSNSIIEMVFLLPPPTFLHLF